MIRRPPRSTRTDTLFPYTTLFRAGRVHDDRGVSGGGHRHLFRPDETPRRLDAQDAPRSIAADRRHRAVLDDVDAAGGGGARIAPGDRQIGRASSRESVCPYV